MKVYIAGPMRGIPEFNFPAFTDGAAKLRATGRFEVCSPHEHDLNNGFNPAGMKGDVTELGPSGFNLKEALIWDLTYVIKEADMAVVLPGWEKSEGAQAEVHAAKAVGKQVMTLAEALGEEKPSPRASALDEARALITGDRNNAYGPPTQDFKRTAGMASAFGFRFVSHDGAEAVALSSHHVAVFLILLKMSRLAWTPDKRDSWVDTAGYAGCGYECAVTEAAERKGFKVKVKAVNPVEAGRKIAKRLAAYRRTNGGSSRN